MPMSCGASSHHFYDNLACLLSSVSVARQDLRRIPISQRHKNRRRGSAPTAQHTPLPVHHDGAQATHAPRESRPTPAPCARVAPTRPIRPRGFVLPLPPLRAGRYGARTSSGSSMSQTAVPPPPAAGPSRAPPHSGNNCTIDWHCTSPPGVPNVIQGFPSRIAIAGLGVSLGLFPGAREDGWSSSSHDCDPRDDRMKPNPGTTGEVGSVSLGVAEKAFPQRSITHV